MEALDLRLRFDPQLDPERHGPLMANCILPGHRDDTASLAIYPDHVWCFGCQGYRTPETFIKLLGDRALSTIRTYRRAGSGDRFIPLSQVELFHQWLVEGPYTDRLEGLYARGLRLDAILANKIGHSATHYTIPILDGDQVLGIRYRRDDGVSREGPKYKGTAGANGVMFYVPATPANTDPCSPNVVVLCEGELDALRLAQEGVRAVSLTNGAGAITAEHAALLRDMAPTVIVAYDQDAAGLKGGWRACDLIGASARLLDWPAVLGKDVTEYLQRWPVSTLLRRLEALCP